LSCCADAATHALAKPSDPLNVEFFCLKAASGERLYTQISHLSIADGQSLNPSGSMTSQRLSAQFSPTARNYSLIKLGLGVFFGIRRFAFSNTHYLGFIF
jgi:hypothetical protein